MRAALLCLVLLAIGCDRWAPCALPAEWRVDVRRVSTDSAASTYVRPSTNGDLLVLLSDFEPVTVAGMTVIGAHLLRVGDNGSILGLAPVDVDGRVPTSFAVTDDGRALLLNGSRVLAYGADLSPAWSYSIPDAPYAYNIGFAAAPSGESAVMFQNSSAIWPLRYLGVDGRERWTVDRTTFGSIRFAANADVIVDDGQAAMRYAAADGAQLGTVPSNPGPGVLYQRDGSSLVVSGFSLDGFVISRLAADGREQWTQTFPRRLAQWNTYDGQGPAAIVGASGDVVFSSVKLPSHTDVEQTEVVRLAGDSGDVLDTFENCDAFQIIASDDDGYIATGQLGSAAGLGRYPWP